MNPSFFFLSSFTRISAATTQSIKQSKCVVYRARIQNKPTQSIDETRRDEQVNQSERERENREQMNDFIIIINNYL